MTTYKKTPKVLSDTVEYVGNVTHLNKVYRINTEANKLREESETSIHSYWKDFYGKENLLINTERTTIQ